MPIKPATKQELLTILTMAEEHTDKEIATALGRSKWFVYRQRKAEGIRRDCQWTIERMHRESGYARTTLRKAAARRRVGRRVGSGRVRVYSELDYHSIIEELRTYSPLEESWAKKRHQPNDAASDYYRSHPSRQGLEIGAERGKQTILEFGLRPCGPSQRLRFQVKFACECGHEGWTDAYRFQRWKSDNCIHCPQRGKILYSFRVGRYAARAAEIEAGL